MGKPVNSSVQRAEHMALNTKVNKEVFGKFKDYCKELGYSMNVVLETFMRQYTNERYMIDTDDVLKWKKDTSEIDILNTTFNKEIYLAFKKKCKDNKLFVKHVITAFMAEWINRELILEYVNINDIKN